MILDGSHFSLARMRRLAIDDTGYYLPALSFITC